MIPPTYATPPVAAALDTDVPPAPAVVAPLVVFPPAPAAPAAPPTPPVAVTLPDTPTFEISPVLYPAMPPTKTLLPAVPAVPVPPAVGVTPDVPAAPTDPAEPATPVAVIEAADKYTFRILFVAYPKSPTYVNVVVFMNKLLIVKPFPSKIPVYGVAATPTGSKPAPEFQPLVGEALILLFKRYELERLVFIP